ncbi:unnamed protein product [Withania somnifera]
MANQGSDNLHSNIHVPGQAQMRREDSVNQPSDIHSTSFFQETGTQVKNIAQGAAGSAVNMARGAATGTAHMVQGAADAVKNTLGMNPPNNSTNDTNYLNHPGTINFDDDFPNSTTTLHGGFNSATNAQNPSTGI